MTKVLSSISLDSPTSPVSASTGNTFTFSGTPTSTGTGGAQAYDLVFQVDPGTGYVTIAASGTVLTTASTNPITATKATTQQSATISCDVAGSYTIRIAGAPTSGGSLTVFSATQTGHGIHRRLGWRGFRCRRCQR